MPQLNAQQASELAAHFHGLAQAIGDYRYQRWNDLSASENKQLGTLQWSLLHTAEDMLARAASLILPDMQSSLSTIIAVTKEIRADVQHLKSVQQVLNLAGTAVTLGSAIISRDPLSITKGIQALMRVWKD